MAYRVINDPDDIGLMTVLSSHAGTFERTLRRPLEEIQGGQAYNLIVEEEQEIQQATFLLRLMRL